jgi:hypothetical protein
VNGTRLGLMSLRADAAYCAGTALAIVALAPLLDEPSGVGAIWLMTIGLVVASWAGLLWWSPPQVGLRTCLRLVLAINAVAAVVLAILGFVVPSSLLGLLLVAMGLEVAAFAVSQSLALKRLGKPRSPRT